jgi:hypothetical protein
MNNLANFMDLAGQHAEAAEFQRQRIGVPS